MAGKLRAQADRSKKDFRNDKIMGRDTHLKCWYRNAHILGNKKGQLKLYVPTEVQYCWNNSNTVPNPCNWSTVKDFQKHWQGRTEGMEVVLRSISSSGLLRSPEEWG